VILAVQEPAYFPAPAYFGKLFFADVLIWADSFQFKKHGITNRTAIKTANGVKWLTVPVRSKGLGKQSIRHVRIDQEQNWQSNQLKSIYLNYKNSPYFGFYIDEIETLFNKPYHFLIQLTEQSFTLCLSGLGIKKKIVKSSQLPHISDRTDRLFSWLDACGCDNYLLHKNEIPLIDVARVLAHGVKLFTFDYKQQPYHQQFEGFKFPVSILDLFFNEGEQSLPIFKKSLGDIIEIDLDV